VHISIPKCIHPNVKSGLIYFAQVNVIHKTNKYVQVIKKFI